MKQGDFVTILGLCGLAIWICVWVIFLNLSILLGW